jgi:hypothetical protein
MAKARRSAKRHKSHSAGLSRNDAIGVEPLVPKRLTLRGLIALQVHQFGDGTKKVPGEKIR